SAPKGAKKPDSRREYREKELYKMRHSCEHVLTQAMLKLWPKIKMAMGPATEDGFYFDFDPSPAGSGQALKISEADFPRIEAEMAKIVKDNLPIRKKILTLAEGRKLFKDNAYKQEWLDAIKQKKQKPTVYWTGKEFVDLCAGPHVKSTGEIGAFKLLSIAGAYWHGSEKNKMLTRIYGTCFATQKKLEAYILQQQEAEKRDHRKLGKNLDLFVFADIVGKGLPMLTPKGTVIRKELEKFVLEEETKRGYQHVITPHLAKVELYEKSGHYPYYKDIMYPAMQIDEEKLILRPMTCPHHFMLYKSRPRSYKELPVRFAEIASQFRYEKSGELSGLTRVRLFCLADAHIMCAKEQAKDEIKNVLNLIDYANSVFGLKKGINYRYRLSLGDRKDAKKYYKDDEAWNVAENILRQVLKEIKAPFYEAKGEAAFYGPKIDIQMKKVNGQEETAFTVQYDFVMPKRFELAYTDKEGKEKEVVVIHRSSIGCFERTMAFLIEFYAGAFPVWLSPVQVWVIPVSQKHFNYSKKITKSLSDLGIRAEARNEDDTLGKKIRTGELQKIPYLLIVGDRELKAKTVAVRQRKKGDLGAMKLDDFISKIKKEINQKK
ncbi:threonine--tRNA ligase, partial [Candidatus Parcubacteria bacterium]|nr:threonine--tRNA ligase [Patescibacteria group bacterium]MCG2688767.1 threonine--tRNA ligase [Candidatus Parcubacteria bacterium]